MYKKILIPVDGSKGSALAEEHALKLAEKLDNPQIVLLHVADISHFQSYSGKLGSVYIKLKESLVEHAEEILGEVKSKFDNKNIPVETKLIWGDPPYDIVREASEGNYDVIIMGSRGSGGIETLLLGSVSNYVSKHAKCSVVIIRR